MLTKCDHPRPRRPQSPASLTPGAAYTLVRGSLIMSEEAITRTTKLDVQSAWECVGGIYMGKDRLLRILIGILLLLLECDATESLSSDSRSLFICKTEQ